MLLLASGNAFVECDDLYASLLAKRSMLTRQSICFFFAASAPKKGGGRESALGEEENNNKKRPNGRTDVCVLRKRRARGQKCGTQHARTETQRQGARMEGAEGAGKALRYFRGRLATELRKSRKRTKSLAKKNEWEQSDGTNKKNATEYRERQPVRTAKKADGRKASDHD